MKISITRADILAPLARVASVADRRSTMPILANVLIDAGPTGITIAATDMMQTIVATVPGKVVTPGSVTVSAKRLLDTIKSAPTDAINLAVLDNHFVEARSGTGVYKIAALPSRDFPKLPSMAVKWQPIDAPAFAHALARVVDMAGRDATRPHINCAHLSWDGDVLTATTTNSHACARTVSTVGAVDGGPVMLPVRSVEDSIRLCDSGPAEIAIDPQYLYLRAAGVTFCAKLLTETAFPPVEQVIPKSHSSVVLGGDALSAAIKRVADAAVGSVARGVKMACAEDGVTITADSPEGGGSERLEGAVDGPIEIAFDVGLMLPAIKHAGTENVRLEMTGPLSPIVVRGVGADAGYLAVVMPMRI